MKIKSNEVKTTSDRVLAAAGKCPTAKAVLKELFPEAFKNTYYQVPSGKDQNITKDAVLQRRMGGNYDGAIFLSTHYNWSLETDNFSSLVLVGRPKY